MLNEVVIPYVNSNPIIRTPEDNLRDDVCYTYEQLADYYGFCAEKHEDINGQTFLERLAKDKSLVGAVSIRNYKIFQSSIIRLFEEKGFLWNLHTGQLPKYRGVFIPYRVIQNSEHSFGWTLHRVDQTIDTGNIIASTFLPLDSHDPVLDTYMGMVDQGVSLVEKALLAYKKHGILPGQKQPDDEKSYYTFPTAKEMEEFKALGIKYIASPKSVIDTYISKFSIDGTDHAYGLAMELISAIAEWKNANAFSSKTQSFKIKAA